MKPESESSKISTTRVDASDAKIPTLTEMKELFEKFRAETSDTPEHITLCMKCYKKLLLHVISKDPKVEHIPAYGFRWEGTRIYHTDFPVLCFNCGHGFEMAKEFKMQTIKEEISLYKFRLRNPLLPSL